MSGTVRVVRQPTIGRDDHWVRAWPLGKAALGQLGRSAALLLAVTSGVGLMYMWLFDDGPLGDVDRNGAEWLEDRRTPTLNSLTHYGSMLSDTLVKVVLVAVVGGAAVLVWRRWYDGVFIALAVCLEASVFVAASFIVGRERPPVEQLDPPAPSGSFPSGHTAAAVAFYGAVAVVATWHTRNRAVRTTLVVLAVAVPLIVAFSRASRGMHHPLDVVAGLLLGLAALWVAKSVVARGVEEIDRAANRAVPERLRRLDLIDGGGC
jgi:undecaprenyl-diphosphatase